MIAMSVMHASMLSGHGPDTDLLCCINIPFASFYVNLGVLNVVPSIYTFLYNSLNMCSFEYPQHKYVRVEKYKKIIFNYALLSPEL